MWKVHKLFEFELKCFCETPKMAVGWGRLLGKLDKALPAVHKGGVLP